MYDINDLRLLAFQKIYEDNSLCCASVKKQLLKYMEEVDEHDIKAYLLDGDLDIIDEDAKPIIDKRFEKKKNHIFDQFNYLNEFVRIGTAYIRSTMGQDPVEELKENYETCKETECDNLGGRNYELCKAKCKLQSLEENRELLEDASNECERTNSPETCREKINKSLEKLDNEIDKTENKISYLESVL